MDKWLKSTLLLTVIIFTAIFFTVFDRKKNDNKSLSGDPSKEAISRKAKVAIIFDDLGETLRDLKEIYSLDTPVTISVIPGLKFSKNIAHIGYKCGFSVFIHLPMEPSDLTRFKTNKYKFITSSLSDREVDSLMRYYLNYLQIAIGVNNHMGSKATENLDLMKKIIGAIKEKQLIFIDSNTSPSSMAYSLAKKEGLICGASQGFLDSIDDLDAIERKLRSLVKMAKEKGNIIVIAHPRKNTFNVLKRSLPELKEEVDFVTIKAYFGL